MNYCQLLDYIKAYNIMFCNISVEDWKTSQCLQSVGGILVDTRDRQGRETFMVFSPETHLLDGFPEWYLQMDVDGALKVMIIHYDLI